LKKTRYYVLLQAGVCAADKHKACIGHCTAAVWSRRFHLLHKVWGLDT